MFGPLRAKTERLAVLGMLMDRIVIIMSLPLLRRKLNLVAPGFSTIVLHYSSLAIRSFTLTLFVPVFVGFRERNSILCRDKANAGQTKGRERQKMKEIVKSKTLFRKQALLLSIHGGGIVFRWMNSKIA